MVRALNLHKDIIAGIKHHHERYDGLGYPDGLVGEAIPITAAVMAVGDAYDAMTSDRPYRKGMPKEVAIEEIKKNSGTQFNPVPAKAMVELFKQGKV